MVKELTGRGAKVDSIGTPMHIAWNNSYTGIDNMMKNWPQPVCWCESLSWM